MQLSAILLARVLVFVESFDLNPQGKAYYPNIVSGLVERCGFMKFPQKIEDFDEDKGVEFIGGRWGNVTIESLKIFRNGIMVDTRVSTTESKRIVEEALIWATSTFGLVYRPEMITRTGYLSYLTFHTDVPILGKSDSPVSKLASRINGVVGDLTGDRTTWAPTVLTLNSDVLPRKPLHAAFTIQRRAETAFSENKYYSEAPLPTDVHLDLLRQFEIDSKS
jgi:hypothetical protein